jgi:hypothetical protein
VSKGAAPVNSDHYAVVVALSKYPRLGDPPPSNLEGPENDAAAVHDWLIDPAGGALPKSNVFRVTSSQFKDKRGGPARDEIQRRFEDLVEKAEAERTGVGAQLGGRLYVYAAGHGFSPALNQGCLHAGDAGQMTTQTNVYFTAWLQLFQEAGYFRETVLWMDCCMNRDRSDPSLPTVQTRVSPDPPGPSFVAFAARRPLRAVEKPTGPKGKVHGVFTTVLLEGLRGAAANRYGMVTGRSLADWLRNAQRGRIDPADLDDPSVSQEPEVIREDQNLIFARGLKPITYPVTIRFPPEAAGRGARLWSGRPPMPRSLAIPASGELREALPPGLYVVDVPDRALRAGFQVTAASEVDAREAGPAVDPTGELVRWNIDPGDPGAEIFIVDEAFNLVDRGVSRLDVVLPFGLYKKRLRSGRSLVETVHLLDRSASPQAAGLPAFSSPAPIPATSRHRDYHEAAAKAAQQRIDVAAGRGGELMLMAREWREQDDAPSGFLPWQGVRIVDAAGALVADPAAGGERDSARDAWAAVSAEVDPGVYYLRIAEDGREREQALVVAPGWRTEAYLLRKPRTPETRDKRRLRQAIVMHRRGELLSAGDLVLDQARVALADERLVLDGELGELLVEKFENPIAGILGGHLLIVEQARRPGPRIGRLDEVVVKLRALVGDRHPDVEALSLRCSDPELRSRRFPQVPPMFEASWQLMVEASHERRSVIGAKLWERLEACSPLSPYLAWKVDEDAKAASRDALAANLAGIAAAGAAAGAGAARRPVGARLRELGLPAVAAAGR